MTLVNTINAIAQGQNITNETDIGENQSASGRISGFGGDLGFGPRVVDRPPITPIYCQLQANRMAADYYNNSWKNTSYLEMWPILENRPERTLRLRQDRLPQTYQNVTQIKQALEILVYY
jgi:hypothetical protein